jgi:4-hydroxy-2-oxoheptanedioate aldolase
MQQAVSTPANSFKQRIAAPGAQIGLWMGLADPYAAELCATTGLDGLLIGGEHGPNDLRSMLGSLQAVAPYPSQWSAYPRRLHEANDRVCLLVQVETASALQQLDEIAAVDSVDGVFIGPADLSASMGHLGNAGHPEVLQAIDGAIARLLAAGKAPAGAGAPGSSGY